MPKTPFLEAFIIFGKKLDSFATFSFIQFSGRKSVDTCPWDQNWRGTGPQKFTNIQKVLVTSEK